MRLIGVSTTTNNAIRVIPAFSESGLALRERYSDETNHRQRHSGFFGRVHHYDWGHA